MKNKFDLMLEKKKIEAGFMFSEMDQMVESSYRDYLKTYPPVLLINIFMSTVAVAGAAAFLWVTRGTTNLPWLLAWVGYCFGAFTLIHRAFKDHRQHKNFIKSHAEWKTKHKKMLEEAGIPVIDREPPKGTILEKVVN